jgi:Fe-S-cluster containining protein
MPEGLSRNGVSIITPPGRIVRWETLRRRNLSGRKRKIFPQAYLWKQNQLTLDTLICSGTINGVRSCEPDIKKQIRPRLLNHDKIIGCPFLLDTVCSIYPVRPLACRDFFVYGEPCKMNEDPFVTRPNDMHPPNREISMYVALRLLDFQGFNLSSMEEKEKAFNDGIIINSCRPMHSINWAQYVRMTE